VIFIHNFPLKLPDNRKIFSLPSQGQNEKLFTLLGMEPWWLQKSFYLSVNYEFLPGNMWH